MPRSTSVHLEDKQEGKKKKPAYLLQWGNHEHLSFEPFSPAPGCKFSQAIKCYSVGTVWDLRMHKMQSQHSTGPEGLGGWSYSPQLSGSAPSLLSSPHCFSFKLTSNSGLLAHCFQGETANGAESEELSIHHFLWSWEQKWLVKVTGLPITGYHWYAGS